MIPDLRTKSNNMKKFYLLLLLVVLTATASAQLVKMPFRTAQASSAQSGEGASLAIDGDYSTYWHSSWNSTSFPVTLTLTFSTEVHVDMLRYVPRPGSSGTNGNWNEVTVEYPSGAKWVSLGTFYLNGSSSSYDFELPDGGLNLKRVRFVVRSGSGGFASAAEVEAYAYDNTKQEAFEQCFEDELFTVLKPGITSSEGIEDADVKALVDNLLAGGDYKKFRVGEYEAYRTIESLQRELKTNMPYNKWENPTGIYLKAGESCYVAVSGIGEDKVGIKIKNWVKDESGSSYGLRNGLNKITAAGEGNLFVNYYTDNFENAPNVKVHFINAPVRGYWDQETMTNSDWQEMLGKLPSDSSVIIVRSEHAQLAYPVYAWKQYCPANIDSLMTLYQQVQWAERDIMGLAKYGREAKNRQLFFATTYGFMAAMADGAFCNVGSIGTIMRPDSRNFDFWGVGHEWGHNNQIRPGLHWSGCGETTNNIYASWAQIHFTGNKGNLRLEDEVTGVNDYAGMRGGRMQTYFEEALRKGVQWQLQDGPDYFASTPEEKTVEGRDADGNSIGYVTVATRNYDHFVKLVPFWQLNLWGTLAGKCPDILPMVIESMRTTENYGSIYNTNGKQQVNFIKLVCDSTKINMLPFFEKAGMFKPINAYIEDYGPGWNIIDEEMIAELEAHVAEMGYPAFTEEINYITGHNYPIYRDNLPLEVPEKLGAGCSYSNGKVQVLHANVKNAVAFETYNKAGELVRITMYGLGSNDAHSFTQVLYPVSAEASEAAAYIMAVGYDGTRKKIFERDNQQKSLEANKFYTINSTGRNNVLSSGVNSTVDADGTISWNIARAPKTSTYLANIWFLEKEGEKVYLYNPQSGSYFTGTDNSAIEALCSKADAPAWNIACVDESNSTYTFNMAGTAQYINAYSSTETGLYTGGSSDRNNIWQVTEVETISVTVSAAGYYMGCYPFALELPEGLEAYVVGAVKNASYEDAAFDYAVLEKVESAVIPARMPVVLAGAAGKYSLALVAKDDTPEKSPNLLHGTTMKLTGMERGTLMYNVASTEAAGTTGRVALTSSATSVPVNRAYLLTTDINGINNVYLQKGENITGIAGIESDASAGEALYYELNGAPAKELKSGGVYVTSEGKKILVK